MQRHFIFPPSIHFPQVIFATATLVAFVLLGNSRLNFHCYTQREPMPTQKSSQLSQLRPFATSCPKDYEGHSLVQTCFTEPPNRRQRKWQLFLPFWHSWSSLSILCPQMVAVCWFLCQATEASCWGWDRCQRLTWEAEALAQPASSLPVSQSDQASTDAASPAMYPGRRQQQESPRCTPKSNHYLACVCIKTQTQFSPVHMPKHCHWLHLSKQ